MTMLVSGTIVWTNETVRSNETREMNESIGNTPVVYARTKSAPSKMARFVHDSTPPPTARKTMAPAPTTIEEVCPICCEAGGHLYTNEMYAGAFHSACTHYACARCIDTWVEQQLPACRANLQLRAQCYGCEKTMPQKLVLMNKAALELANQLERREALQRNELFPPCMQVECRRAECVGIGYLGYETIMCMVCEEQWNAAEETVAHHVLGNVIEMVELTKLGNGELATLKMGETLTITVRKCPRCGVITEKNGGCDHMRCRQCKHEYYWSTGKRYR